MSRSTQPHRAGMNRAPSPVLDRMLAGRATGEAGRGRPLAGAMKRAVATGQRFRPRTSGNTRGPGARY